MRTSYIFQHFSERVLPTWCVFMLDVFLVAMSVLLACLLRYDLTTVFSTGSVLSKALLWIVFANS